MDAKEFLDVKEDVFGVKTEILWGKRAHLQGNLGKRFFFFVKIVFYFAVRKIFFRKNDFFAVKDFFLENRFF